LRIQCRRDRHTRPGDHQATHGIILYRPISSCAVHPKTHCGNLCSGYAPFGHHTNRRPSLAGMRSAGAAVAGPRELHAGACEYFGRQPLSYITCPHVKPGRRRHAGRHGLVRPSASSRDRRYGNHCREFHLLPPPPVEAEAKGYYIVDRRELLARLASLKGARLPRPRQ
jgi:hypothetical protein